MTRLVTNLGAIIANIGSLIFTIISYHFICVKSEILYSLDQGIFPTDGPQDDSRPMNINYLLVQFEYPSCHNILLSLPDVLHKSVQVVQQQLTFSLAQMPDHRLILLLRNLAHQEMKTLDITESQPLLSEAYRSHSQKRFYPFDRVARVDIVQLLLDLSLH
jgi:hypothetical protein